MNRSDKGRIAQTQTTQTERCTDRADRPTDQPPDRQADKADKDKTDGRIKRQTDR